MHSNDDPETKHNHLYQGGRVGQLSFDI